MKLNLGCGDKYLNDFVNVDVRGKADVYHDLDKYPYPFKNSSVDFILASHILEHLKEPIRFFYEIKRILKNGGIAEISVPHYKDGKGAYSSFGHKGFYHELAIKTVCEKGEDSLLSDLNFIHISTRIQRGRFLKWQKRQIFWRIQKK